eukprot:s693_g9.t1
MEQKFHIACTTKALSILNTCLQCHIQFAFYSMIIRSGDVPVARTRRKYDWWEFRLLKLVEDDGIADAKPQPPPLVSPRRRIDLDRLATLAEPQLRRRPEKSSSLLTRQNLVAFKV